MKRLLKFIPVILAFLVVSNQSFAQQMHVNASAKKAFAKKFPNAQNVSWGKENPKEYEAEFTQNGEKWSANFDLQGHWVETEAPVSQYQVPKAVMNSLLKNFEEASLQKAYKITNPKGHTTYEMEVKMDGKSKELVFASNGKVIQGNAESGEGGEKGEGGENDEGEGGGGEG